jgi:hypothetical protein
MDKFKVAWVITLIIIFLAFYIKGAIMLDPDFGWHFKMGELITKSGIPKTDPFSYTMPSFPFIDHEWLSNVIIYNLYQTFGYNSLIFLYSVLALLSILIILPKCKVEFVIPPAILSYSVLLPYFGVRPQVISWLFLAVLLKVVLNNHLWDKYKYFLPILVLIWTNLHGSFDLSLVVILITILVKAWQNKKLILADWTIFILSTLATFINPYGPRVYVEIWSQISDSSLHWRISEWQSSLLRFDASYLLLIALSAGYIKRYFRKLSFLNLSLFFFFLVLGLSTLRHNPFFSIIAIFTIILSTNMLIQDISKLKGAIWRFKRVYLFFTGLCIMLFGIQSYLTYTNLGILNEKDFYPKKAVQFLKEQNLPGNIFNHYDWGGYLIWKYPEKKVFIDGRMPSWRRSSAPANESKYAFNEYDDIQFRDANLQEEFSKYNIKLVLMHNSNPSSKQKKGLQFIDKINDYFTGLFPSNKDPKKVDFQTKLNKIGWKEIYKDNTTTIYKSP